MKEWGTYTAVGLVLIYLYQVGSAPDQAVQAQQIQAIPGALVSNSITIDSSAFGINVRAALNASNGYLQNFTIRPGEVWSFNASVGNPDLLNLATIVHAGDGWCNLAARYAQVARSLGLDPVFQDHGLGDIGGGPENSVAIWNTGGVAGFDNGAQDLIIENTRSRSVHFAIQNAYDEQVQVVGWEE